ncbi:protein of unknown function [Stenotrophomonas maltophilia]|nr:protein of unknown function [Stenotrophomonas maltophilia]
MIAHPNIQRRITFQTYFSCINIPSRMPVHSFWHVTVIRAEWHMGAI